jgi:Caspase domain
MARQACISIGIDRYQFFQPLSFASADARSIQSFCTDEAGWNQEQCLLMTDNSTALHDHSTLPNRENIQQLLDRWCWETLASGDFLCFFFSGYGVSTSGGEYLLPIDADPQRIEQTGLSLAHLYRQFSAPGISVLVFLDVNRSGGFNQGFGQQASQLAQEFEIPTFLSCQPQEFSHEAMGLRHSIFTAALLEALRFNPHLTFDHLKSYLASRVPELSEHHWQPTQHPLALLPNNPTMLRPIFSDSQQSGALVTQSGFSQRPERQTARASSSQSASPSGAQSAIVPYQPKRTKKKQRQPQSPTQPNRVKPILIGLIGVAIAGGAVFSTVMVQQASKTSETVRPVATDLPAPYVPQNPRAASSEPADQQSQQLMEAQRTVRAGDATSYVTAIALAQNIPQEHPKYKQAQGLIGDWAKEIYLLAKQQAAQEDWGKAIAIAKLVPDNAPMHPAAQNAIRLWEQQQTKKSKKPTG